MDVLHMTREQLVNELLAMRQKNESLEDALSNQKSEHQRLQESERMFRSLVEHLPAVTYVAALDDSSTSLYISPQIETLLGISPVEYQANPDIWRERLHPDDRERVLREVADSHDSGTPFNSKYRMLTTDGRTVWIRDEAVLARDENGQPIFLQGIIRDVSYIQATEDSLRDSLEFTNTVLNASPVGIMTYTSDGSCVSANPAAIDATGGSGDQLLSQNFRQIESWKTSGLLEAAEKTLATGIETHPLIHVVNTFGKEVWFDCCFKRFMSEGKPHLLLLIHDVAKMIEYQKELQKHRDNLEALVAERTSQLHQLNVELQEEIALRREAQRKQQLFVELVENSNDFIGMASLDGKVTYLNRSGRELVGLNSIEEALNTSISDYYSDQSPAMMKEVALHTIMEYGSWKGENQFRHLGKGLPIDMDMTAFLIRDPDTKEPVCTATISRDITQRKAMENKLRQSEESLKALLNAITEAAILVDLDETIVAINETSARRVNQKVEHLVGQNIFNFLPPKVADYRRQHFHETIRTRRRLGFRDQRDGFIIENTYYPVFGSEGEVTGIAIFAMDVTEHRQAQEALEQSEERFRSTFDQAAVGMAIVSPNGHFLRLNQRFCDIVGYSSDELMEMTFKEITHPDDIHKDMGHVAKILADEIPTFSMEKRYIRKDGSSVWANLTVSLTRLPSGEPHYFIGVIEDISRRKRAEDEQTHRNVGHTASRSKRGEGGFEEVNHGRS